MFLQKALWLVEMVSFPLGEPLRIQTPRVIIKDKVPTLNSEIHKTWQGRLVNMDKTDKKEKTPRQHQQRGTVKHLPAGGRTVAAGAAGFDAGADGFVSTGGGKMPRSRPRQKQRHR